VKTNKFRLLDTVTDAAILVILFVPPSAYAPEDALRGDSLLSQLLHLVIVFLCYFGLAYSYADVYYAVVRKRRQLVVPKFHKETPFVVLSVVMFISLILSAIAIWTQMEMPIFPSILVGVQSLMFGMSFGMEVNLEADPEQNTGVASSIRRRYGHSITDYMPYLVLTFLIVYPLDYILRITQIFKEPLQPFFVLATIGGCVGTYFLGKRIEKWVAPRLEISKEMNTLTLVATSTLSIVSVLSLGFMQLVASNNDLSRTGGLLGAIVVAVMFGIIPLRVTRLLMMRHAWAAKLIGATTIGLYLLREFKVI
jgi:hypothetical protein